MNNKIKIWFEKQRKPPYNTNLDRENLRMITIRDLEELLEDLLDTAFEQCDSSQGNPGCLEWQQLLAIRRVRHGSNLR